MKKYSRTITVLSLAIFTIVLMMFALAVSSCHAGESLDKYAIAHQQWQSSDKPLVVWYTADWCGPCKLAHAQYESAIASGAIVVKLDVDRDRVLIAHHKLPMPANIPALAVWPPRSPHHKQWHPLWLKPLEAWPRLFIGLPGFRLFLGR